MPLMVLIGSEAATGGFLKERCSLKFRKIHRKAPVPESLF